MISILQQPNNYTDQKVNEPGIKYHTKETSGNPSSSGFDVMYFTNNMTSAATNFLGLTVVLSNFTATYRKSIGTGSPSDTKNVSLNFDRSHYLNVILNQSSSGYLDVLGEYGCMRCFSNWG